MTARTGIALLVGALACAGVLAQEIPPGVTADAPAPVIEPIADEVKLPPAEVAYVHPLWRPLDEPPKLAGPPVPADYAAQVTLFATLHVDDRGRISEGEAVQPPLAALAPPIAALFPKWRFSPAMRAGMPVITWATYGIGLEVTLEEATYSSFSLLPVVKDQPVEAIVKELTGEAWLTRYPRDISPKDPAAVSVEDVDVLPMPEKASWSFSSARVRSHVTALVDVTSAGAVRRIVPTGTLEPMVLAWMRQGAADWRITPATAGGKAVDSWMTLDATLEYTIDDAKQRGKRSVKKNLRGTPSS